MKLVQDHLKCICESIQSKLGLDNALFYYSTPTEFVQKLASEKDITRRYPFFFVSSMNVTYSEDICTVEDIVLATWSKAEWKSYERDEKSIKPILIPMYKEFLEKLKSDRHLSLYKEGDLYIHYFYGNTGIVGYESGIFPDHVDAIQLRNFKFRLSKNKTCKL